MREDSAKLLNECYAGIKMGISSINDVLDYAKNEELRKALIDSKEKHLGMEEDCRKILNNSGIEAGKANGFASFMSKIKTDIMLTLDDTDKEVASLITDGCNMGIKSLTGYLNDYSTADEGIKDMVMRLIKEENKLLEEMKKYL